MTKKLKASDILQEAADEGVKQTFGKYYNRERTEFCGLGVIRSRLGLCKRDLPIQELNEKTTLYFNILTPKNSDDHVEFDIINWNDKDKLSFGEIAQLLRERYNL